MITEFPPKLERTKMEWSDLVVPPKTMTQIGQIKDWLQYNAVLLADNAVKRKVRPGYKALFVGTPETGKKLTASLLAKHFDKDVYRIDLSAVVSKHLGETEKYIDKIFDAAEQKKSILLVDEAEALFGKRTNVQDSHDRYANQEVSYLLQRMNDFKGLVIVTTQSKTNFDSAFTRHFNTIVRFPIRRV